MPPACRLTPGPRGLPASAALLLAALLAPAARATQLAVTRLRVNNLPLAPDAALVAAVGLPSFSWELALPPGSAARGVTQLGLELEVSTSASFAPGAAVCRAAAASNASRVSPPACNLTAAGTPVGVPLFLRVRVNGSDDGGASPSPWAAAPRFFVRGAANADFAGGWVALEGVPVSRPVRLRAVVQAPGSNEAAPASAVLLVAAPSYYRLSSAGAALNAEGTASFTEFKVRIHYDAYDVTALFAAGPSALAALGLRVGGGPWAAARFVGNTGADALPVAALVVFVEADGTRSAVAPAFRGAADTVTQTDWYEAEMVDNRLSAAFDLWDTTSFDDSAWRVAAPHAGSLAGALLLPQLQPPVRRVAQLAPASVVRDGAGNWVASFPQNFAGRVELDVPVSAADAGATVVLSAGERLFANGSVWNQLATNMTLAWTLRGGPGALETAALTFPFWGAQHVELRGWPAAAPAPTPASFRGFATSTLARSSGIEFAGVAPSADIANAFAAGRGPAPPADGLLDAAILAGVYHAVVASQLSNFQALPSDCPNREKRGWTGDGAVSAKQAVSHFDMAGAYASWILSMTDDSAKNAHLAPTAGLVSDIVPSMGGPADLADAAWGQAIVEVTFQHWRAYGDDATLRLAYPFMRDWVRYLVRMTDPKLGIMTNQSQFGDWDAQFNRSVYTPNTAPMGATAAHLRAARILSELAPLAGHPEDAPEFAALVQRSVGPFNAHYALNLANGTYGDGFEQTLAVLPLALRFVPAENLAAVQQWLIHDIETTNGLHLTTGATGTRFLFEEALSAMGRTDLAAQIAAQSTLPSHGYWVTQGATTAWENWSGEEDETHPPPPTHNHIFLGSHVGWQYERLLGLRQARSGVAFEAVELEPPAIDSLPSMRGFVDTVRGRFELSWAWAAAPMASPILLNASLPPNAFGLVILPTPTLAAPVVSEGGVVVWKNGAFVSGRDGVTAAQRLPDGAIAFSVGSGTYTFATSSAEAAAAAAMPARASACAARGGDLALVCPAGTVLSHVTGAGLGVQRRRHRFLLTHALERLCLGRAACRVPWSDLAEQARPADLDAEAGAGEEVCAAASCVEA